MSDSNVGQAENVTYVSAQRVEPEVVFAWMRHRMQISRDTGVGLENLAAFPQSTEKYCEVAREIGRASSLGLIYYHRMVGCLEGFEFVQ